jgi:hypothetical protein
MASVFELLRGPSALLEAGNLEDAKFGRSYLAIIV